MNINEIKTGTRLRCPESDEDYMITDDELTFWIDDRDVWNVDCYICGGTHGLGDTE